MECVCVCCVTRMRVCINKGTVLLFAVGLTVDIVPVNHIRHNARPFYKQRNSNSFSGPRCRTESSALRREKISSKRQSIFTTLHGVILKKTSFVINNAVKSQNIAKQTLSLHTIGLLFLFTQHFSFLSSCNFTWVQLTLFQFCSHLV